MSTPLTRTLVALAAVLCLALPGANPAWAAPTVSADRAALASAVGRYEAALAAESATGARVREVSATLDRAVAEQNAAQARLRTRAAAMYRAGDASTVSLLLGASSFDDFITRLDLLTRLARQDAENLTLLKAARLEAEQSAGELLELQAKQAQATDALAAEVAKAKATLAASEAALAEYHAKVAAAKAATAKASAPAQQLTGSGEWRVAVASHYGINFTGRGANGEAIGPYSMIVAHKTLPFGTLIEFEYNGARAVARVTDRGPFVAGREFDLGPGVVRVLGFNGVHEVRYRIITQ